MKAERNWRFDVLKCMACIVIVFLHARLPGIFGDIIIYAFRFSVPVFAMITGYYSAKADNSVLKKRCIKMIRMLIITEIIYGVWSIISFCINEGHFDLALWSSSAFGHKDPFRILFFGTMFNGTLWYLYAAVWTYVILMALNKAGFHLKCYKYVIALCIPILVIGRLLFQRFYDITDYTWLFYNAPVFILPMTMIGILLSYYREMIVEKWTEKKAFLLILAGNIMIVIEFFVSRTYMDFHFSTLFISVGLMIMCMVWKGEENAIWQVMAKVGRDYSMIIYLSHFLFKMIISDMGRWFGIVDSALLSWMIPFGTLFLSFFSAWLISRIMAK